jgi:hypothetical protein
MKNHSSEEILAERAKLESVAAWNEQRAHLARKNGDHDAAQRHLDNALSCRWRQR